MDNCSSISKMVLIVPILLLAISAPASSITETNPEMEKIMVSAIIEEPLVAVAAYLRQQEGIEEGIRCIAHGQYCTVGKEYECCSGTKCIHYNMSWGLCIKQG